MMNTEKILYTVLCCIVMIFSGCSKTPSADIHQDTASLGTYSFDGKDYPIYSAAYVDDGRQIMVRLSPIREGKMSTYIILGINASLNGTDIDVDRMYHNDDYFFRYEDPLTFYSEYRDLKSGTINIERLSEGVFNIKADIVLLDDREFRLTLAEFEPDPQTVD